MRYRDELLLLPRLNGTGARFAYCGYCFRGATPEACQNGSGERPRSTKSTLAVHDRGRATANPPVNEPHHADPRGNIRRDVPVCDGDVEPPYAPLPEGACEGLDRELSKLAGFDDRNDQSSTVNVL